MSQVIEVERQLRKMILTMELGPGERLTERWAEARFNASRTPVRAAFQQIGSFFQSYIAGEYEVLIAIAQFCSIIEQYTFAVYLSGGS